MSDVTFLTVYHAVKCEDNILADITHNMADPDLVLVKRLGFTHFHVSINELSLDDCYTRLIRNAQEDPDMVIRVAYGMYKGCIIEDTLIQDVDPMYGGI